jgi:CIC family chloride channel protein
MGAMLGGVFGGIVHSWFPQLTAQPGAYALVSMAAVFSAAARAPISAVIILFEMTGDYRIILPLMLSTVISTTLAGFLEPESIYTKKLSRRGTHLRRGRDLDVMQSVRVSEVMTTDPAPIPASMSLNEVIRHFQVHRYHAYPVLDKDGLLSGVVSLYDLDRALEAKNRHQLTAQDLATRNLETVFPDEPMWTALQKMGPRELSSLPVVDRWFPRQLLGVVRRRDIIRAYNVTALSRTDVQGRLAQAKLVSRSGTHLAEFEVMGKSPVAGRRLAEVALPTGCVVVSIVRKERVLIPRGGTRLQAGDVVTLFVQLELETELSRIFSAGQGSSTAGS